MVYYRSELSNRRQGFYLGVGQEEPGRLDGLLARRLLDERVQEGVLRSHEAAPTSRHLESAAFASNRKRKSQELSHTLESLPVLILCHIFDDRLPLLVFFQIIATLTFEHLIV